MTTGYFIEYLIMIKILEKNVFEQLCENVDNNDAFALTLLGIQYIENYDQHEQFNLGIELITFAGDSKNCIWAKNLLRYIRYVRPFVQPFTDYVLVEKDALEQLKIYADSGNMWAMTALGNLLFTGYSNPQNKDEGAKYLNMAADKSCYLALELIQEYGIKRVSQPAFGKIYDALKNKDYSKFWLK